MATYITAEYFTTLYEIFPDAFDTSREYSKYVRKTGEWGIEKVEAGTGTENLAECILYTAEAIGKGDTERGLNYIRQFAKKSVQRKEIEAWYK